MCVCVWRGLKRGWGAGGGNKRYHSFVMCVPVHSLTGGILVTILLAHPYNLHCKKPEKKYPVTIILLQYQPNRIKKVSVVLMVRSDLCFDLVFFF